MRVYIFSPQVEIAELIADNLTDNENMCIPFPTFTQLYEEVKNAKKYPDLLILDYMMYNHEAFSITENLNQHNIYLPVVWYNDPCIQASSRVRHWKTMIKTLQCENEPNKDLSHFDDLFLKLQNLVECDELRPYIALMQKPEPLPEKYIRKKITLDYIKKMNIDNIKEFQHRSKLSDSLYYLLTVFFRNKDAPLTKDLIIEEYKKDFKTIEKKSLNTMICNLRKAIRDDGHCNFYITGTKKFYTFIMH